MKFQSIIIFIGLIVWLSACEDVEFDNSPDDNNQNRTDSFLADSMVGCISEKEQALIDTLQAYRVSRGLPKIPVSKALTKVADIHVWDLKEHKPAKWSNCNLHSWSDSGNWTPCCYTPDHDQAECMWDKPRELTSYSGKGFEIAYWGSNSAVAALNAWKKSPLHHNVIINEGKWSDTKWEAIGVSLREGYGAVWFGRQNDPKGPPEGCSN